MSDVEGEGVEREEGAREEDLEEGELERSFDSLIANASATGVPSLETSLEVEEVSANAISSLNISAPSVPEEEEEDENRDEDSQAEDPDDVGVHPASRVDPQSPENWAYADFKLQLNLMLQFSTASGEAALLSVDNIDLHNGGVPPSDRRVSDMSGYTAGSSGASGSGYSVSSAERPRNLPRASDVSSFSTSTLSSQEARLMQPQILLTKKRLSYLCEKYWNHELLYYIIDYIDQVVTQVPREEEPSASQPMQVKRGSKRAIVKNPKRRKLDEIEEVPPPEQKIIFAKPTKTGTKFFPARSWSLEEDGDYMVEFYNNDKKRVIKRNVFEDFQDSSIDRQVVFARPGKFNRKTLIPGLVLDIKYTTDDILCDLMTDEGDLNDIHISNLYITEESLNMMCPSRKLILPIKKSKRYATETETKPIYYPKACSSKSQIVHITGTDEEYALDSGAGFSGDHEPDTTSQSAMTDHEIMPPLRRQQSFSTATSSSDDSDPLQPSLEVAEGCEPEKRFFTPFRDMYIKCKAFQESKKNCEMLGPLEAGDWFKDMIFMLTCSKYCLTVEKPEMVSDDENYTFSAIPFVFNHLAAQIKLAGGRIYENLLDVPPEQRKNLLVIAPKPCLTARFLESVASNVKIICHEWIVNCCRARAILPQQELPLGWSVETNRFINSFDRLNNDPFANISVRITSRSRDNCFYEFWGRVMRTCGAHVYSTRRAKYGKDLIILDGGYRYASLPITVTPTWVIQCVIHGELRLVSSHEDYEYHLF